ncbi:MAG: hypothetical protein WA144_04645 [Candidatus Methanoperedens sp.]
MKKFHISVLLASILIVSVATLIYTTGKDYPTTLIASSSWPEEVLNNTFLSDHSDSIVTGYVIKILPGRWNTPDGKKPIVSIDKRPTPNEEKIYTDVIIKVDKKISKELTSEVITVRTLGGQVGEDRMIVEDEAKFELGENVLLFLTKEDPFTDNSDGAHYRITSWKHGKFSITKDNQAVRSDVPTEYQKIPLEMLLKSIGAQ